MADDEHSLFSASGADGWGGGCPGKPAMEEGRKTTSSYADEGTAAHTLASWVLTDRINGGSKTAGAWLGQKIQAGARKFTVSAEMVEHVDDYVDRFMLYAQGGELFCEQRVHYHEHLGVEKALAFGTGDGIAILFDQPELEWQGRIYPAGDELQIHDLKYGRGVLVVADGFQMKLYAGGSLYEYGHLADFVRVRMVIHQPRKEWVDEVVMTVPELLAEIATLRPAVPQVIDAMAVARKHRASGMADLQVGEALDFLGYLAVSEKGCRFCDAQAVCPAKINEVGQGLSGREKVTAADFEDLTVDSPAKVREYGGNYLAAAYAKLDAIEGWSKAIRSEIDRRVLLKGEQFDGVKVVAGRKSPRRWIDQGDAEAFVRRLPAPIQRLLFKSVMLTPTQMEGALRTSPAAWMQLQPLITQDEGQPAVVPMSDSRKPISHKALVETFEDLTQEEQPPARVGAAGGRDRHPFR